MLQDEGSGDAHEQNEDVRPQALPLLDRGRVRWPRLQVADESDQCKVRHDVECAVERERGWQVTVRGENGGRERQSGDQEEQRKRVADRRVSIVVTARIARRWTPQ